MTLVLNLPSPLSLYCCNRRGGWGGELGTIEHKPFFLDSQPFLSCILTAYTQVYILLFPRWSLGARLLYTNTYLHGYVIRFWLNCKWKKFQLIIRAVVKLVTFPGLFKQAWEWDYRKYTTCTQYTLHWQFIYSNYELSGTGIFVAALCGSYYSQV